MSRPSPSSRATASRNATSRGGPRSRHVPVDRQHADQPVEDDDRRREDRARAELEQALAAAWRGVCELRLPWRRLRARRSSDPASRGWRPRGARGSSRRSARARRRATAPSPSSRRPGSPSRTKQRCARSASATTATACSSTASRLESVRIRAASCATTDSRSPSESRNRSITGAASAASAWSSARTSPENARCLVVAATTSTPITRWSAISGTYASAPRSGGLYEPRAHALRGPRVVDRERRRVVIRAGDSGRLVRQVETNVGEPRDVFAAIGRDDAVSLCTGRVDEHERGELRASDRRRALDDLVRRLRDRGGVAQAARRRAASPARSSSSVPLAEPREQDERGDERDQDRCEPRPAGAADGLAVAEHEQPEDDRRDAATGEDESQSQLEASHRVAGARRGRQARGSPRGEVHDPEHEQGDCVQPDGLLLGCHWAFVADSREASAAFPARATQSCSFKRWAERPIVAREARKLAWTSLGDASRGCLALRPR